MRRWYFLCSARENEQDMALTLLRTQTQTPWDTSTARKGLSSSALIEHKSCVDWTFTDQLPTNQLNNFLDHVWRRSEDETEDEDQTQQLCVLSSSTLLPSAGRREAKRSAGPWGEAICKVWWITGRALDEGEKVSWVNLSRACLAS